MFDALSFHSAAPDQARYGYVTVLRLIAGGLRPLVQMRMPYSQEWTKPISFRRAVDYINRERTIWALSSEVDVIDPDRLWPTDWPVLKPDDSTPAKKDARAANASGHKWGMWRIVPDVDRASSANETMPVARLIRRLTPPLRSPCLAVRHPPSGSGCPWVASATRGRQARRGR